MLSGPEGIKWAFPLVPQRNELLSGYLCRVAAAHGASPHGFCSLYLADHSFWARDVDRGVVNGFHGLISAQAGLSYEVIREMTLDRWRDVLVHSRYRTRETMAVTPWINAVGVFHRQRRQHALQFCRWCLAETGIIRKEWRLSFFVICDVHGIPLSDACSCCDAAFIPHRSRGRGFQCHACRDPLAVPPGKVPFPAPHSDLRRVAVFQAALSAELAQHAGETGKVVVSDRLLGIRDLISAISVEGRGPKTAELFGLCWSGGRSEAGRLEFARVGRRTAVMAVADALMKDWPDSFRRLGLEIGLTQVTFARLQPLPQWVQKEVEALPPGLHRVKTGRTTQIVKCVADIEAKQPENWRVMRAGVLLRAARGR